MAESKSASSNTPSPVSFQKRVQNTIHSLLEKIDIEYSFADFLNSPQPSQSTTPTRALLCALRYFHWFLLGFQWHERCIRMLSDRSRHNRMALTLLLPEPKQLQLGLLGAAAKLIFLCMLAFFERSHQCQSSQRDTYFIFHVLPRLNDGSNSLG